VRQEDQPEAYIAYTNTSRDDPVEWRYKSATDIEKLRELKKKWDPKGRFTQTFL